MKNALMNLSTGKLLGLSIFGSFVISILSICYGPVWVTNPFFLLSCYITVRLLVFWLFGNFEGYLNAEFKQNLVYGQLGLHTGILMVAFAIPDAFGWKLLVVPTAGWLLLSGVSRTYSALLPLWNYIVNGVDKTLDQRSFRKHMKNVAETARVEDQLSADLRNFITGADNKGTKES